MVRPVKGARAMCTMPMRVARGHTWENRARAHGMQARLGEARRTHQDLVN